MQLMPGIFDQAHTPREGGRETDRERGRERESVCVRERGHFLCPTQ